MTLEALDNLARIGKLKREPPNPAEQDGLLRAGLAKLADASHSALSFESRFDLAYGAGHALALRALRVHGFRSDHRYLVFQCLQHTTGLGPIVWRVLAKAHEMRNLAEYEGDLVHDERLLADLILAVTCLADLSTAKP